MSTSIDQAFVKQFEREVHHTYQRKGSRFRMMVRRKNNIKGSSTTFQKAGKGQATTKSRHGIVPAMNIVHTPIECTLTDHYAGDYVDKLDEAKINHDERRVLTEAGAFALGRKTDNIILTAMDGTTNSQAHGSAGLTKAKVLTGLQNLGDRDVFEEGRMFFAVGFDGWSDLLDLDEFKNSDFTGDNMPWLDGVEAKRWLGTLWFPSSALNDFDDGSTKKSFWWNETSTGCASGAEVTTDITWEGPRVAHWVNNYMSMGACLIDDGGVEEILYQ